MQIFKCDNKISLSCINKVKTKESELKSNLLNESENNMILDYQVLSISMKIKREDDFLIIDRTIQINQSNYYSLDFEIEHGIDNFEVFIPSLLFKRNKQGKGNFPKLNNKLKSFSFLETRSSISGCIELYNDSNSLIIAHSPNEIQSSTNWDNNKVIFSIPAIECPYRYLGKSKFEEIKQKDCNHYIYLYENQIIKQEYYLYFNMEENIDMIDQYYKFSKHFLHIDKYKRKYSIDDYKAILLRHLLFLVENDNDFSYLKMGKGNFPYQDIYEFTSASFLVKSIECASLFKNIDVNMIKSKADRTIVNYLEYEEEFKLDKKDYSELAYRIGDYFLKAESKSGLFRDCYSLKKKIWGGYLGIGENDKYRFYINSRTNGEALISYLHLANNSDKLHKRKYFKLIDNICSFYLDNQLENGNYGRWWDEDGNSLDGKGTNGAYIFRFFIEYFKFNKREDIFESIQKAIPYYTSLIENKNFFGDTLDAESYDKEAGQILLSSFINLYEIENFKNDRVLNLCKKCANYLITWIQLDDIIFDVETPLGKRDFKTKGLTNVSIANQHLDCYGMMIAYDFLNLNQYVEGDTYFKFAQLMINACFKLISMPDDLLDRNISFLGWIPEQINHTSWDYFNDESKMNGYYSINIAWVQVLVLDYLLKIEEKFPGAYL